MPESFDLKAFSHKLRPRPPPSREPPPPGLSRGWRSVRGTDGPGVRLPAQIGQRAMARYGSIASHSEPILFETVPTLFDTVPILFETVPLLRIAYRSTIIRVDHLQSLVKVNPRQGRGEGHAPPRAMARTTANPHPTLIHHTAAFDYFLGITQK